MMLRKYKTQREKQSINNIVVESKDMNSPFHPHHYQKINSLNEEESDDLTESEAVKNDTNESFSFEDESPEIRKESKLNETSIDSKNYLGRDLTKKRIQNKAVSSDIYSNQEYGKKIIENKLKLSMASMDVKINSVS